MHQEGWRTYQTFAFSVMNRVEDKTVFLVLCLLIRMVEGNGWAMQSVSAASILMNSAPEGSANRMAVS